MQPTRTLPKLLFLPLCMLLLLAPGCAALAVGAAAGAGVAYVRGDLKAVVNADPERTVDAAVGALNDLGLTVSESDSSGLDGRVRGRTADDTSIDIRVERVGDDTSEVRIRIGVFGDESKSRAIYDAIRNRL